MDTRWGPPVDFKEATDQLLELGVTLGELAEEMGGSEWTIRQARLDPDSDSYRSPPSDWQLAISRLCSRRAQELAKLAEKARD